MAEAVPIVPNISQKRRSELEEQLGGCMNALHEVHTADSLKIQKLEESVSALMTENGRLVETLKEEVAKSSSVQKDVEDALSAYMEENETEWVRRVLHNIEASSQFRNILREAGETYVAAEIARKVERLTEEHLSSQSYKKFTEDTCTNIAITEIPRTVERLTEEYLSSQPCRNFIQDTCKAAVNAAAEGTPKGNLPCLCALLFCPPPSQPGFSWMCQKQGRQ